MQKLTIKHRELAELFQVSPSKNGYRVLFLGGLSVMFATFGVTRLLSTAAAAQTHALLASIRADTWVSVDFTLAAMCIAWWYFMEWKARRLRG